MRNREGGLSSSVSCRQFGIANEGYAEYAIERLSISHQAVQALNDTMSSSGSPALSMKKELLRQLLQDLEVLLHRWVENSETLNQQRASTHYIVPTEIHGRGFPELQGAAGIPAITAILMDSHC